MDAGNGDGNMNLRNWGFFEPPRSRLGLQLISEKPVFDHLPSQQSQFIAASPFHHHHPGGVSDFCVPIEYWMNQSRGTHANVLSGAAYHQPQPPSFGLSLENSSSPGSIHLDLPQNVSSDRDNESSVVGSNSNGSGSGNGSSSHRKKKARKQAGKDETSPALHRSRIPRKSTEVVINGVTMNISKLPIPVCTCTGTPRQCYRWGSGGWQSACCTTGLSVYPLPMNTKRRGARIAGRKMSIGAFKKVLEKLSSQGYDFSAAIDLRAYWAKHGTNKFVTIR